MGENFSEPEDTAEDEINETYCDEVEQFDEDAQAQYLYWLRQGMPARMAARECGFTPRVVRDFRKRNALFDEACEESIAEADEKVEWEARQALKIHEPWAVKLFAEKLGWKREQQQKADAGGAGVAAITGSPLERIMKIQAQVLGRTAVEDEIVDEVPEVEVKSRVHKRPVINVSLADEDE